MEFQVPQFIKIEPKISFFTFRQLVILIVSFFILAILNLVLESRVFMIVSVPIVITVIAFGFLKFNGRSFTDWFFIIFIYFFTSQVYIWRRDLKGIFGEDKISEIPVIKGKMPLSGRRREEESRRINEYEVIEDLAKKLDYNL